MNFKTYLDKEEINLTANTVETFLSEVNKVLQEKSRVIKNVKVDDKIDLKDMSEIGDFFPDNMKKIEFSTVSYIELCNNTMQEMLLYLEKLDDGYDAIVELVENEKINEAMTILNSAVEGIEWMNTAFGKILNVMRIELDEKENDFLNDYSKHLSELMQGLENQDYITLKDVILYDLKEDITKWKKMIEKYMREGQNIQ